MPNKKKAKNRIMIQGDAKTILESLEDRGTPHTVRMTQQTTRIEDAHTIYTASENFVEKRYLSFIGQVKAHAKGLDPDLFPKQPYQSKQINYYRFNRVPIGETFGVTEVDVNGAYWELAYKLGYLSEKLYLKGLEVPKRIRLIAFGALATRYRIFKFDGTRYHLADVEPTPAEDRARSYFFHVAHELGQIMQTAADTYKGVLWYWVDAFFVYTSEADKLADAISAHGLDTKRKEIEKIESLKDPSGRHIVRCHMAGEDFPKDFTISNRDADALHIMDAIRIAEMVEREILPEISS